jgi:dTDP-4-amino-4,6-dideoxygalactose transaminase
MQTECCLNVGHVVLVAGADHIVKPGSDIQAALGLHQLKKLPQLHARRREIVQRYQVAFQSLGELVDVPTERTDVEHAWHLYVLRLNPERMRITRDEFINAMHDRNIGCSVHFIPIHLHQYYRDKYGYRPEEFPIALREYQRMVSLPLSPRMINEDVDDVIAAVRDIFRRDRPETATRATDFANV